MELVFGMIVAGSALAALLWRRRPGPKLQALSPVSDRPLAPSALSAPELEGVPLEGASEVSPLGQRLGGYELVELLGEGGMATVYKARARGGDVALKRILEQFAGDEGFRRRFEREVQVCKDLQHPNIVGLLEWGEDQGVLFLVLEYVDGEVLSRKIRSGGLPVEQCVDYLTSLIDGLSYAHDRGVVHRDLKPDNILVSSTGAVKIADFGLARSNDVEKITKTGDSMGTPAYFPPEQIAGARPNSAADQYSLGIIFYELLTGVRPFNEPNPLKLLFQHLSEVPLSPLVHKPELPPILAAIVLRMLEKNPESRFPSLKTVKEGVLAAVRGEAWELPAQDHPGTSEARPEVARISAAPLASGVPPASAAPLVSGPEARGLQDESTIGFQVERVEPRS